MNQVVDFFQTYEVKGGPEFGRENLPKLRAAIKELGLTGFLIPHEDEYQNEYLPDCNERLMWATGFTGSAGAAIVRLSDAVMFVDGRYTIQVRQQVDPKLFDYAPMAQGGSMAGWLREHAKSGEVYGYDPKLHSPANLKKLRDAVALRGASLKALEPNPIDTAWEDRPPMPMTPIRVQSTDLAGKTHADKRAEIAKDIKDKGAEAALITAPASIAWLLNIRGGDVKCTPLPLSTAIIHDTAHVEFFVAPEKLTDAVRSHLGNDVAIKSEADVADALKSLSKKTVIADPNKTSAYYFDALKNAGASVKSALDPVALPKACKNQAELDGTTEAHKRDGAAIVNFLHWLDTQAQSGTYDEIEAATKLETLRHATGVLNDLSFETISGAQSNGALCHYRVNEATNMTLAKGSLYLVDSGGQYNDGTTDITRTVPIGEPTQEMRERFTLVLKGHIGLATIRFPEGTTGSNLDAIARYPLWQAGLDYDHGTGHGVGVFLGVHEGPQRISKAPNSVALRPGMIVSNEPGYYKEGEYGIRIENLQYVTAPEDVGGERDMLGFENLTWAPIHRGLIEKDMLTRAERDYVNDYHAKVWEHISPRVEGDVKAWLKTACAPI